MVDTSKSTILVKKADGTSVRMTLEEFRTYQETKKLRNLETVKLPEEKIDLPMEIQSEALTTTAPVKEIFVDEAKAKMEDQNIRKPKDQNKLFDIQNKKQEWSREDHRSPLEENIARSVPVAVNNTSNQPDDEVGEILKRIKFSISNELRGRLRSLIISRLKDVRTNDQVIDYAVRAKEVGGLGLSEIQAQQLLAAINPQGQDSSLNRRLAAKKEERKVDWKESGEKIVRPSVISTIQPEKVTALEVEERKLVERIVGAERHVLQDVTAPAKDKKTLGPVEELRQFTLTDFRRLAVTTQEAGRALQEKFTTVRNDSYLWYVEAVDAWQQSPLYKKYLQVIKESIASNKKIAEYLQAARGQDQLKEEEFKAIVKVDQGLNM